MLTSASRNPDRTVQTAARAANHAPGGATIEEIVAALEWRPHPLRGAIAGPLKKRLGLTITSEKIADRGRCCKIETVTSL
ncbi:DUF3489 domain-containing protein [Ruixingdingia sedimenti]|uniref:DUF3489 domain-containing protein n=1 Tax=Ruixingdingia sedimenti TaxID=3073604 RepID=A0ABU1FBI4_9RHOB|nr:DUF3489 domain-containing protein [Xinfangfangia sp. LG-4]MDR5654255.1 DUF3489 domain-containing protein [Xinfangfangia sp. LG-4]